MHSGLADFRIESDNVVWLALGDGRTYRLNPADLEGVLEHSDVLRVRQALKERTRFMKRILPPTIMLILVAGVVGLGNLDMHQLGRSVKGASTASACLPTKAVAMPQGLAVTQLFPEVGAGGQVASAPAFTTSSGSAPTLSATTAPISGVAEPAASPISNVNSVQALSSSTPAGIATNSVTPPVSVTTPVGNLSVPPVSLPLPTTQPTGLLPSVAHSVGKTLQSLPLGL